MLAVEGHQDRTNRSDLSFNFGRTGRALITNTPVMAASSTGGSLVLSWPRHASYFQLYTATNLAPPVG